MKNNNKNIIEEIKKQDLIRSAGDNLLAATLDGNIEKVNASIKQGGRVDTHYISIWSNLLIVIAKYGHEEIVKILLKHGANFIGIASLAEKYGEMSIAQFIRDFIIKKENQTLKTIVSSNLDEFKLALDMGVSINTKSSRNTLLTLAIQHNKTEFVDELMKRGVDVCLSFNVVGNKKIEETLCSYVSEKNIDFRNKRLINDFLLVAAKISNTKMALELIENGADVNTQNSLGDTPLILALMYNHPETFSMLLYKGASL